MNRWGWVVWSRSIPLKESRLICASGGEKRWFGPEEQHPGFERLGQIRIKESLNGVAPNSMA
jgi:hypothetical protein